MKGLLLSTRVEARGEVNRSVSCVMTVTGNCRLSTCVYCDSFVTRVHRNNRALKMPLCSCTLTTVLARVIDIQREGSWETGKQINIGALCDEGKPAENRELSPVTVCVLRQRLLHRNERRIVFPLRTPHFTPFNHSIFWARSFIGIHSLRQ